MVEVTSSMIALVGRLCQVPDRPLGSRNLGTLLRDPWLELNARLNARVAERGFADARPALSVVFQHMRDEGSRITDIAERAQLTKPTVVYLVNELEALGYVERIPDPHDGRAKLVCCISGEPALSCKAFLQAVQGQIDRTDQWLDLARNIFSREPH